MDYEREARRRIQHMNILGAELHISASSRGNRTHDLTTDDYEIGGRQGRGGNRYA